MITSATGTTSMLEKEPMVSSIASGKSYLSDYLTVSIISHLRGIMVRETYQSPQPPQISADQDRVGRKLDKQIANPPPLLLFRLEIFLQLI
jgi:hypothetical protein